MYIQCITDPKHDQFSVIAHIAQEWLVGSDGQFVEVLTDCTDTIHKPDLHDRYLCRICGQEAVTHREKPTEKEKVCACYTGGKSLCGDKHSMNTLFTSKVTCTECIAILKKDGVM